VHLDDIDLIVGGTSGVSPDCFTEGCTTGTVCTITASFCGVAVQVGVTIFTRIPK